MIAAIERTLPGLTAREWGAIAVLAARRAGLDETEVSDLRRNLENEWACQRADARATQEHGPRHHDRATPRSPRAAAPRRIPGGC